MINFTCRFAIESVTAVFDVPLIDISPISFIPHYEGHVTLILINVSLIITMVTCRRGRTEEMKWKVHPTEKVNLPLSPHSDSSGRTVIHQQTFNRKLICSQA